jgi:ATP-dependent RNA helicase RhlE
MKSHLLSHLIMAQDWKQVLVFTRTKHGANRLTEKLISDGIPAAAIHGNKSQPARTRALAQFKDGTIPVLVATDIAARGLDIDQLPHVVNFELPNIPEDYVHRIGRTGRAGHTGTAISLVDQEELPLLKSIERLIRQDIPRITLDSFAPPANIPVDTPRTPRQARGTQRKKPVNGSGNTTKIPGQPRRPEQRKNAAHALRDIGKQNQHSKPAVPKPDSKRARMSEAARHQALPQPPLFSPKSVRRGR